MSWTPNQALTLAPDAAAAKAAQSLASARLWTGLGQSPDALWGLCQGSGKDPYQTQVALAGPAFRCTCPSRKQPCKHGLGLLLLFATQPTAFPESSLPAWVSDWLADRAKRQARATSEVAPKAPSPSDDAAVARRLAQREGRIQRGIQDLDQWLRDTARRGLADLPERSLVSSEEMAARLVDAQAPGLARLVRQLAALPSSGSGWQERVAEQLGRLYLLLEGYRRQADLPPEWRAHVRSLVGWAQPQDELLAAPGVQDRWVVQGRAVELEDRLRVTRTWLWGETSQRAALVLDFTAPGQPIEIDLVPGTIVPATLVFYPGPVPLRALVKSHDAAEPLTGWTGQATLAAAQVAYGAALAQDPWLERWPVALESVWPHITEDQQWIQDSAGSIWPLAPAFAAPWELLALSGGRPIGVFGEWNGRALLPLAAWVDGALAIFSEVRS